MWAREEEDIIFFFILLMIALAERGKGVADVIMTVKSGGIDIPSFVIEGAVDATSEFLKVSAYIINVMPAIPKGFGFAIAALQLNNLNSYSLQGVLRGYTLLDQFDCFSYTAHDEETWNKRIDETFLWSGDVTEGSFSFVTTISNCFANE